MATILCDIDGTISAAPLQFSNLLGALQEQGNYIAIVSGSNPDSPSGATWQDKANYLQAHGVTDCWDILVVVSGDIPAAKAQWCVDNGVSVAIDNNVQNAKAMVAANVPLVLVPWATKEKTV